MYAPPRLYIPLRALLTLLCLQGCSTVVLLDYQPDRLDFGAVQSAQPTAGCEGARREMPVTVWVKGGGARPLQPGETFAFDPEHHPYIEGAGFELVRGPEVLEQGENVFHVVFAPKKPGFHRAWLVMRTQATWALSAHGPTILEGNGVCAPEAQEPKETQ